MIANPKLQRAVNHCDADLNGRSRGSIDARIVKDIAQRLRQQTAVSHDQRQILVPVDRHWMPAQLSLQGGGGAVQHVANLTPL